MIELQERLDAFARLGEQIEDFLKFFDKHAELPEATFGELSHSIRQSFLNNNWFTIENQILALQGIRQMLKQEVLQRWIAEYTFPFAHKVKTIAVVMAGNIPAVGFHDLLCVLVSGNAFLGKYSSEDAFLLPAIARMLCNIEPRLTPYIHFEASQIKGFDAVIATGSDNTARYFAYYFGRYPHIIRGNRNSMAILSGKEDSVSLGKLAVDVFSYFGLGCRNVSHLLLPAGFHPPALFGGFEAYRPLRDHHKYFNNYEYHKAVCIINKLTHYDNGFLLLIPDDRLSSPVGVLHYSYYENQEQIENLVEANRMRLQCIVSDGGWYNGSLTFGSAQFPGPGDYADGVDTMDFLLRLQRE